MAHVDPTHPIALHLRDALLACRDLPKQSNKHGLEIARDGDHPVRVGPLDQHGCALAGWSDTGSGTGHPPGLSQHQALAFHDTLRRIREAFASFVDALRAHPALGEAASNLTVRLQRAHPHAPTRHGPFVQVWMEHLHRDATGPDGQILPDPKGHTRLLPTHWSDTHPITVARAIALFEHAANCTDAPRLHAIERPGDANPFQARSAWIGTDALRALEPFYAAVARPLVAWVHERHQEASAIGRLSPRWLPASLLDSHARLEDVSRCIPDLSMQVTVRGDGTTAVTHPALDGADAVTMESWLERPHARYHAGWAQDVRAAWSELWAEMDAFAPAVTRTARAWQHAWHIKPSLKHPIRVQLSLFGVDHRIGGPQQGAVDGLEDVLSWMADITPHDGWAVSRGGVSGPAFVPGKNADEALAVGLHLHRVLGAGTIESLDLWTPAG